MFGDKKKKRIYLGTDHGGFKNKDEIKTHLETEGFEVVDLGCFGEDPCDYPDVAREVAEKVAEVEDAQGLLICRSGVGMEMTANKLKGIRAVRAETPEIAEVARKHNNANVLTMGGDFSTPEQMKAIADKFFTTEFEAGEERHVRRVKKIDIF